MTIERVLRLTLMLLVCIVLFLVALALLDGHTIHIQ